jgi:UDP-N-acetylglucosamine acyltransferase
MLISLQEGGSLIYLIEGSVQIGSGTEIQGHAVISGCTRVGKNNRVGYGAVIGSLPQDLSFNPKSSSGVEIGDNNVIREYCTIHRGTKEGFDCDRQE